MPAAFRLAAKERRTHSAIRQALENWLEILMIQSEAVQEEHQHVRAYLIIHVVQAVADNPWIGRRTIQLAADPLSELEAVFDQFVGELHGSWCFGLFC